MISVIVPVYDSAAYLEKCINSVLRQTYTDFELLLVDDGSHDGSARIGMQAEKMDRRIHVLQQPHQGVSAARNVGMENAAGEYFFFLDSDDVIHPKLLETLYRLVEKTSAVIAASGYSLVQTGLRKNTGKGIPTVPKEEEYVYLENQKALAYFWERGMGRISSAIGGKLIRRDVAKSVSFREDILSGEDTLYLYHLFKAGADMVILRHPWYGYRQRKDGISRLCTVSICNSKYHALMDIRDLEQNTGRKDLAIRLDYVMIRELLEWYMQSRRVKNRESEKYLRCLFWEERSSGLWKDIHLTTRIELYMAFFCYPLYYPLYPVSNAILKYREKKEFSLENRKETQKAVGILTFYWADDYGAVLQAYALKTYFQRQGMSAEIIPYAPIKLRGRYQMIPLYAVQRGGRWRYYRNFSEFYRGLRFISKRLRRRDSMSCFRKRYLTPTRPIEKVSQLCLTPYDVIFVGSDQIWNSDITLGADDAYMGYVGQGKGCRLVAYGASFGRDKPPKREWKKWKRALEDNFTAVSLREKRAADFTGRLLGRPVADVLDPVLLLEKDVWEAIEQKPREKEYILLYATEFQESMYQCARELSRAYGRPVIQLSCPYQRRQEKNILLRMDAGPKEFIGYFHHASCIITNSFHGLAFSVLFEKPFLIFRHNSYHARNANLLEKFSLTARLMEGEKKKYLSLMEKAIDWAAVQKCLLQERKQSERFIKKSMERI